MRQALLHYRFDVQARPYACNLLSLLCCRCVYVLLDQVVVSGPGGFTSKVEKLLDEMGVPGSAMVLLD